jgi:hypothetical protein
VVQHLLHDVAEQPRLAVQPGEGLHHHHVGERVLRVAGQARLAASPPCSAPFRSFGSRGW